MGKYINQTDNGPTGTSFNSRCDALISDGATPIEPPTEFIANLVCVVNNKSFAAAGYAYSENEMRCFLHCDGRQRQWFIYPNAKTYAV